MLNQTPGISVLPGILPKIIPGLTLGLGAVNPLLGVAAAVLPEILKAVVGDKGGTVAGAVTEAVEQITQTKNPEEARNKLNADPSAVAALQLKLAEIAADHEEKRQQAQLALLKEQNEQETTPSKLISAKSSASTNTSITRTGLLSSMKSSRHSGNSVHCPRSASSTKRLINSPAESRENHNSSTAFSHSQGHSRRLGHVPTTSALPL